uniref:Phosphatidylserine synthase n=2 Tax=Ciona intestinalis TaxID=7719 RepID=F6Q6W6_CIOIN
DGYVSYFWQPHTLLVLLIGLAMLAYAAFFANQNNGREYNTKRGIIGIIIAFITFGITQAKDGPFIRPHPAFWRLVLCMSVVYELSLVFLLLQTVSDARFMLTYIDPTLNAQLDFKAYGGECTIWDPSHPNGTFHNVVDKMDLFVPAHLIGWFFRTLAIRDVWLTNILSFTFELLEYTFEHQLPNFSECWWDHWVMDFIVCNGLGIYLGLQCLNYLSLKEYRWYGLWNIPTYTGKVRRVINQFGPYNWLDFKWRPTESIFRWMIVSHVGFSFLMFDLNTFYLKFVLWIPSDHPLISVRILFMILCAAVTAREEYDYASGMSNMIGQQSWMVSSILMTELAIVVKFGGELLSMPIPTYISWFWWAAFVVYVTFTICQFRMKFSID